MAINPYQSANSVRYSIGGDTVHWSDATTAKLNAMLRIMWIVSAALIMGLVMFCLVGISQAPAKPGMVSQIAVTAMIAISTSGFFAGLVLDLNDIGLSSPEIGSESEEAKARVLNVGQQLSTRHVIACAFREGGAFFSVFLFGQSHNWLLLIPAVVLILSIIAFLPTLPKLSRRIARVLSR